MSDPICEKCGLPITTALMAVICPKREECEFWPEDEIGRQFIEEMRDDEAKHGR
jgi:hypothetical protein